jgi:putative SOS response-associated peptidase YedK
MAELHDRMPVILDPADYDRWPDPSVPGGEELLRSCPAEWLEAVPVSTTELLSRELKMRRLGARRQDGLWKPAAIGLLGERD